jgi:transposase-like protein
MKRKDLYNFIREEIINELTPAELNAKKIKTDNATRNITTLSSKLSTVKDPNEKKEVEADLVVAKEKLTIANSIKELARTRAIITIKDPEKAQLAKEIYEGSDVEKIIDAVINAGENGITQEEISKSLGIPFNLLTQNINELTKVGAFSKPKKSTNVQPDTELAPEEEPEITEPEITEPETVEPEELEPEKDSWETPEPEEEKPEEEPDFKTSDKEIEKIAGGELYAKKLSPEEEEKFNKFKTAISKRAAVVKDKKSSDVDVKVARQFLDKFKANKELVDLFKKKGLNLITYINNEIK